MDNSLVVNKVSAILVITVLNTIFTLIPLFATSFEFYKRVMDIFNSIAGGLMLGISVLEMLDSDQRSIDSRSKNEVAGAIFIISFVSTFFIHFYFSNIEKMKQAEVQLVKETPTLYARMDSFKTLFARANRVQEDDDDDDGNRDEKMLVSSTHSLRVLFSWTLAISIESFFSCIVLASQTKPRLVWILFTSIVSGDWAECMILGQKIHNYFQYSSLFYQFLIVALMQFINIAGFAIGIMADMLTPWVQDYISTILFAALSGVFLYMSMIDMIMKELYTDLKLTRRRFFFKIFLISLGIALSIVINVFFID